MQFNPTCMSVDVIMKSYEVQEFDFEPPYQREGDVWSEEQKSLFIDSLMRNYPIPMIYLNKKNRGSKYVYEVIDGKQRLSTIISFYNGEFALKFDKNETGYLGFDGRKYQELKEMYRNSTLNDVEKKYIENFDSYPISFQIIQDASNEQIKDIFDRLNRGESLNAAEIIHGNYYPLPIYKNISNIAVNNHVVSLKLDSRTGCPELSNKRRKNVLFWTNIFLGLHNKPLEPSNDDFKWFIDGTSENILTLFRKYKIAYDKLTSQEKNNENNILQTVKQNIINSVTNFEIIYKNVVIPHNIARASHLYTLFQYSYFLYVHHYSVPANDNLITAKLNEFFDFYASKSDTPEIVEYRLGMSSNSPANRKRRFNALKKFVNVL